MSGYGYSNRHNLRSRRDYATPREAFAHWREFLGRKQSRPLANNTRAEGYSDSVRIRLHSTDVLTFRADGSVTVDTGGWNTQTTRDRMNSFLPAGWHVANVPYRTGRPGARYTSSRLNLFRPGRDPVPFEGRALTVTARGRVFDPNAPRKYTRAERVAETARAKADAARRAAENAAWAPGRNLPHVRYIRALGACDLAQRAAAVYPDASSALAACEDVGNLDWLAARFGLTPDDGADEDRAERLRAVLRAAGADRLVPPPGYRRAVTAPPVPDAGTQILTDRQLRVGHALHYAAGRGNRRACGRLLGLARRTCGARWARIAARGLANFPAMPRAAIAPTVRP